MHIKPEPTPIPTNWNCLNAAKEGTGIIHYTTENTQPWYNPRHPFRYLWQQEFESALNDGILTKEEIKQELKKFKQATKDVRGQGLHPFYTKYAA